MNDDYDKPWDDESPEIHQSFAYECLKIVYPDVLQQIIAMWDTSYARKQLERQ